MDKHGEGQDLWTAKCQDMEHLVLYNMIDL